MKLWVLVKVCVLGLLFGIVAALEGNKSGDCGESSCCCLAGTAVAAGGGGVGLEWFVEIEFEVDTREILLC